MSSSNAAALKVEPVFAMQRESVIEALPEIRELAEKHWSEVAPFCGGSLQLNEAMYIKADEAGLMRLYTVRSGPDLVGYAAFMVSTHPQAGTLQAMQEALYLEPDSRRGSAGIYLVEYAEAQLAAEGVKVVFHSSPVGRDLGRMFERLGYELVERIYAKRI